MYKKKYKISGIITIGKISLIFLKKFISIENMVRETQQQVLFPVERFIT